MTEKEEIKIIQERSFTSFVLLFQEALVDALRPVLEGVVSVTSMSAKCTSTDGKIQEIVVAELTNVCSSCQKTWPPGHQQTVPPHLHSDVVGTAASTSWSQSPRRQRSTASSSPDPSWPPGR